MAKRKRAPKARTDRPTRIEANVLCPTAGLAYTDARKGTVHSVREHFCDVVMLTRDRKGVFFVCNRHLSRGFINDKALVEELRNAQKTDEAVVS